LLFAGAILYHVPFFALSKEIKIEAIHAYMSSPAFKPSLEVEIYFATLILQTLCYILSAHQVLRKFRESGSSVDEHFFSWLQKFNMLFCSYWFLDLAWNIYRKITNVYYLEADFTIMLSSAVAINILAYTVLYHNKEFSQYLLGIFSEKYKRSSLSEEQSKAFLKKLVNLMEAEKPYLDPYLKINDLAKKLSISTNILSQVLNQEMSKNFFEFINEYRIAEAIKKLSDSQYSHLSIIGVALDSGFNSKNTFYRFLKKHTGLTPTQYIRNHAV
jgi:AraC-like DNA-binding protein